MLKTIQLVKKSLHEKWVNNCKKYLEWYGMFQTSRNHSIYNNPIFCSSHLALPLIFLSLPHLIWYNMWAIIVNCSLPLSHIWNYQFSTLNDTNVSSHRSRIIIESYHCKTPILGDNTKWKPASHGEEIFLLAIKIVKKTDMTMQGGNVVGYTSLYTILSGTLNVNLK